MAVAVADLKLMRDGLTAEASRRFIREHVMAPYARTARGLLHLIEVAREGEEDAHEVLTDLAGEHLNRGFALPPFLATYVAEGMYGHRSVPRGKKKKDYMMRDIMITNLVGNLSQHFGLRPTRNSSSRRKSACAIVADALGKAEIASVKEKAVERIYNRYWGAVRPTNPAYRPSFFATDVLKLSGR